MKLFVANLRLFNGVRKFRIIHPNRKGFVRNISHNTGINPPQAAIYVTAYFLCLFWPVFHSFYSYQTAALRLSDTPLCINGVRGRLIKIKSSAFFK